MNVTHTHGSAANDLSFVDLPTVPRVFFLSSAPGLFLPFAGHRELLREKKTVRNWPDNGESAPKQSTARTHQVSIVPAARSTRHKSRRQYSAAFGEKTRPKIRLHRQFVAEVRIKTA